MSFSSLSPSTVVLSAFKTASLFSSIYVAIEYSITSIFASPFPSFAAIRAIIDLTFKSSSMNDISRTYFISLFVSIAAQNNIGAALRKLSQNVWSSHSWSKFTKTDSGGVGIPDGIPVV